MMTVPCPVCDEQVPVTAKTCRWPRRRIIFTDASWADLWAHMWTHEVVG